MRRFLAIRFAATLLFGLGVASAAAARPLIYADVPRPGAVVGRSFHIGGWALDTAATRNAGIGVIHIWAYPNSGAAPIFLGIALEGGHRPDVARAFGPQYARAGFGMNTFRLAPGGYRVVLFPFSNLTRRFEYDAVLVIPLMVRASAPQPAARPAPAPAPTPRPSPSPSSPSTTTLKVLDWNTHHGTDPRNVCSMNRIIDWIVRSGANVVSLNEVEQNRGWCNNADQPAKYLAALRAKTGKTWYSNFAEAIPRQGNLILTTFPIESSEDYSLSYDRSVARVQIIVNGIRVNVFSTHLDAYSSTRRAQQISELKNWADNYPEQRIAAGDFNASPGAAEIARMTSTFRDSWAQAVRNGTASSFAGNDGDTRGSRIDYIFYSFGASRLVLKSARVLDTRDANGVMASDHRPLVTTFEVR